MVDRNLAAIELTRHNAQLLSLDSHRLEIALDELIDGRLQTLGGRKFDIIVSNPPYIPSSQIDYLQKEVQQYAFVCLICVLHVVRREKGNLHQVNFQVRR